MSPVGELAGAWAFLFDECRLWQAQDVGLSAGDAGGVTLRTRCAEESKRALHCAPWMLSHCQKCWQPLNGVVVDVAVEVRACQQIGCRPISTGTPGGGRGSGRLS